MGLYGLVRGATQKSKNHFDHNCGSQKIKEPVKEPTLTFASLAEKLPI